MLTTSPTTQSLCAQVISHAVKTNQHKLLSAKPSSQTLSKLSADRYLSVTKISCSMLETPTSVVVEGNLTHSPYHKETVDR